MKRVARKPSRSSTPLSLEALALAKGGDDFEIRVHKVEIDGDRDANDLKSERVQ